uniref:Uncharacterized protein n=1 Tax=Lygus hesperus TaxID=30085 RepID=A0A0A9Z5E0_LYGHE
MEFSVQYVDEHGSCTTIIFREEEVVEMEMGIETPLTPPTSPPIEQHNELYSPASPLPQDEELFSPTSPPPQYEELYPSPPSPADVLPRRMYCAWGVKRRSAGHPI